MVGTFPELADFVIRIFHFKLIRLPIDSSTGNGLGTCTFRTYASSLSDWCEMACSRFIWFVLPLLHYTLYI